eukprot:GGOE01009006.1.p1 GENE.GGOE01009006.1~~GGOE01009006.1.p1  ORF type:complete len:255 (-),score=37.48 GGOE01009006.1:1147-1878(-)
MPAEDSLVLRTGYSSLGAADLESRASGSPALAFVHNPYSFSACELLALPPSPSSATHCTSLASGHTSVGSRSITFNDASSPRTNTRIPQLDSSRGVAGGLPHPQCHGLCVGRSSSPHDHPSPSPKHHQRCGNTSAPARPPVPLQWRRYGTAVSHTQALKDLQGFNLSHPVLSPSPMPLAVWVGPPSPAAPAALSTRGTPPAPSPASSVSPSSTHPKVFQIGAILRAFGSPPSRPSAAGFVCAE